MQLAPLFAFLVSFVFCASHNSVKECSKELEEVIYSPKGEYKEYLTRISKELKHLAFFYDTPQANSIIKSFINKYKTFVKVYDAMGNSYFYDQFTDTPIYISKNDRASSFRYTNARVVINLGAYLNSRNSYSYSFLSFNCKTGVMYEITIGIFKSSVPEQLGQRLAHAQLLERARPAEVGEVPPPEQVPPPPTPDAPIIPVPPLIENPQPVLTPV